MRPPVVISAGISGHAPASTEKELNRPTISRATEVTQSAGIPLRGKYQSVSAWSFGSSVEFIIGVIVARERERERERREERGESEDLSSAGHAPQPDG